MPDPMFPSIGEVVSKKKVYYAHSQAIYGTPQEERDVHQIQSMGFNVLNPSQGVKQDGYKKQGMEYFKALVLECQVLFFRAHPNGDIPAGVGKEIQWALESGRPVVELPRHLAERTISVEATRTWLSEVGQR